MITRKNTHTISGVFVFLLLGIFALCSTVMVLLGAQAYRAGADRAEDNNSRRIAAAYVRGKLREADAQGMILTEEIQGSPVLKIRREEEETVTLLFVRDGMLWEWYTFEDIYADTAFDSVSGAPLGSTDDPEDLPGESVCPLDEMRFSVENGLITADLRCGDEWFQVITAQRCALR